MRKISIITVTLITSSLLLAGCGGGENDSAETVTVTNNPSEITPPTIIEEIEPVVTDKSSISLTGVTGTSAVKVQRVSGVVKQQNAIVDAEFSNATGEFIYRGNTTDIVGNVTFAIAVSDPDGITDISIFLPDVQREIVICSENCGTDYSENVIGYNPQLSGLTEGVLRIELFVTDSAQNTAKLDAQSVNWRPIGISGITATRENNKLSVSWNGEASLARYNVYAATEPNLTPLNALSLEHGVQQLAIRETSIEIDDLAPEENYYLLITGIDENGESGLSVPLKIDSTLVVPNQAPFAVTDLIEVDEDSFVSSNILINDIDPENSTLSLSAILSQPSNGTLSSQSDGQVTYTPNANFNGNDSFVYQIADDVNNLAQATVSIIVNNVNDAPVAANDSFNLEIDNTLTSDSGVLIANDFDIDGDFLFVNIIAISQPLHGNLQLNSDGSFIYTDNGTFIGSDSFEYQVTDNKGGTSTAEVTLLTSGQDITPVAVNDNYEINEDVTLNIGLANSILSNDTDPNQLELTLNTTLLKTTSHGQLNLATDGTFTYIPDTNFYGIDDFKYEIENTLGETSQAFASIRINPVADIPTANDDNFQTNEDNILDVDVSEGLLANDSDVDGGTLSINQSPIVAPQQGNVLLNKDGSFIYTPNNNFQGFDTFDYQVINLSGNTSIARANITINAINDAPQAINDNAETNSDTPLVINVIANDIDIDGDNITIVTASIASEFGAVTIDTNTNTLLYTPLTTFEGVATINYTIEDSSEQQSSATVDVAVNLISNPNEDPVAVADSYTINEDVTLTATSVLNNDSDPDGGTLAVLTTPIVNVSNGSLLLNSDGTFIYTPDVNYNGTDNFTYRLTDGQAGFTTSQVTITVNPVNDPPVAVFDNYSMQENTSLTVIASDFNALLSNDSDIDGNALTVNVSASSITASGTISLDTDGEFTYTPDSDFVGTDTFNYQLEDDQGGSSTGSVSITVINVNASPVANQDNYNIIEGNVLNSQNVLDNDTDADNDVLTVDISFLSEPSNGNVVFSEDGTFIYTPNNNFFGADSFTYMISDGNGGNDEGLINITISADPDAQGDPLARTDNYSLDEDTHLFETTLLDNDESNQNKDFDVSPLTVSLTPARTPENGILILQNNGSFTYTPNTNYAGNDSFEYVVTNIYNKSATATVNLTINPIDDAPIAIDDVFTVEMNSGQNIGDFLLDNDSDPENLHIEINENPFVDTENGKLTLGKHGDFEYTPDTGYIGTDQFIYELADQGGNTDLATVIITITPAQENPLANLPPVANDDSFTVSENSGETILSFILNNDSDPEGGNLSINTVAVTNVEHGTLVLNATGTISYTPDNNYLGTDSFVYQLVDDNSNTDNATVTITVGSFNTAPQAITDIYNTQEGIVLYAGSVTSNDTDIDDDTITFDTSFVSSPSNGSVVFATDGSFVYTPNAGFFGNDSFNYQINDGNGNQDQGLINISISANPAIRGIPLAITDAYIINEDSILSGNNLLDNDSSNQLNTLEISPLVVTTTAFVAPENGNLILQNDGNFTYQPNANFSGSDSFQYEITNIYNKTSTSTVQITVFPVNDTPIANNDAYTTNINTILTATSVLDNDTDSDIDANGNGDTIIVDTNYESSPSHGTVVLTQDGVFVYTPETGYSGTDSFNYKIVDGLGLSGIATVNITINQVNNAPVTVSDMYTTDTGITLNATSVLDNDTDVDGDTLSIDISFISSPLNGNVEFGSDGTFVYTPNFGYVGSDLFTYKAIDNNGGENEGVVNIVIEPTSPIILQPFARDDYYTVQEGESLSGGSILDNDDSSSIVFTALTATIVNDVTHGTLVLESNGEFSYTPDNDFIGEDSFIYSASHFGLTLSSAIVNITITESDSGDEEDDDEEDEDDDEEDDDD